MICAHRLSDRDSWRATVRAAALAAAVWAVPLLAAGDPRLDRAQTYLDGGQPEEAVEILDAMLKKGPPNAEALLLRSTGRVMLGDLEGGFKDLQRAIRTDPALRQAWLNLAGLEIAEGRYPAARDALIEARELDPSALDNELNLGAVVVLMGDLEQAAEHFAEYLRRAGATAEAHFQIASNYAIAGQRSPAIDHLRRAIALDERARLRARADSRFLALDGPRFQDLLRTDSYVPPPGAHARAAAFKAPPRTPKDNRLLYAVLEALGEFEIP